MDIENLNKSQMILLTLLVSFITSIATGIVTVSLLQQAPPVITETVNRIVERTVERVIPSQAASAATSQENTQPQTVVIKESELVASAVQKISPAIVRLYSGQATSSTFLGIGVVAGDSGTIIADAGLVGDYSNVSIQTESGARVMGGGITIDKATGIAYILATSTKDGISITWTAAPISPELADLGQFAVLIAGKLTNKVAQGIISASTPLGGNTSGGVQILETSIAKDAILPGSPIMDSSGRILGISTSVSRDIAESGFIAGASIRSPHTSGLVEKPQ
jgi:hypothetical protein